MYMYPYLRRHLRRRQSVTQSASLTALVTQSASLTALNVFRQSLTEEQMRSVSKNDYFDVMSNTGVRWRIFTNLIAGNLFRDVGSVWYRFCVTLILDDEYPKWDQYLAQALMIRTDEAGMLDFASPMGTTALPTVVVM